MAYNIFFSLKAAKEFQKLDKEIQKRILKKLKEYALSENLSEAKRLTNPKLGTYRYRIGEWRVIFDIENKELQVLKVGHRKEIYD